MMYDINNNDLSKSSPNRCSVIKFGDHEKGKLDLKLLVCGDR